MKPPGSSWPAAALAQALAGPTCAVLFCLKVCAADPDLILHHGRIVTVDPHFTIHQALAVTGERIEQLGRDEDLLPRRGAKTRVIDLEGRTVLPGLIDSHVHPGAAMTEFNHPIPEMESVADVLAYIRSRATTLPEGEWIQLSQVFITRLREQRYPTRQELDQTAPRHPVVFATGPDAMLNSLALKLSGIDAQFEVKDGGPGFIERDPATGQPTGLLRSCTRLIKSRPSSAPPSDQHYYDRTLELFRDYCSVGLTAVADRNADAKAIARYQKMRAAGDLPLRLAISHAIGTIGPLPEIQERIRRVAEHPLRAPDPRLRIIGIKTFLDGGMLTGSAYMRQPWGLSSIYGITDAEYRGVLFIPEERLLPLVETAINAGLQFTAHSVGDGAVHALLEAYDTVNRRTPVRPTRPCVTHSNFMSREALETAARLGVVLDIQPAWLYLDTRTLVQQFGYDRLRYFQPLRTAFEKGAIAGGGSDHMQKIGSFRSVNPYNPFLGMWVAITRQARWYEGALHPEESLTRAQALQFYTRNNAYLLFWDHEVGSLEKGKRADFIIVDRDPLTCPIDDLRTTEVLATYVDGKAVFER